MINDFFATCTQKAHVYRVGSVVSDGYGVQMQTPANTLLHHIHFLAPLAESPRQSSGAIRRFSFSESLDWRRCPAFGPGGNSVAGSGAGRSSALQAAGLRFQSLYISSFAVVSSRPR